MKSALHSKKYNKKNISGLSLIEVMMALAVIGISVLVLMLGERNKWATFSSASKTSRAVNVIEDEIELVRMNIVEDPSTNWPPCASPPCCSTFSKSGINFELCFENALKKDGSVADNLLKLELHADWKIAGKPEDMTISTYIARDF
ncbi:MAG: prepilin-type N-terminal cleavage/methylation domain-containing protein [Chitinivibrionales bacterium]|nr:prepilin-type N-terminal cleavage/methylation domain-containing protein [Chitinivibrionales bacterium]